MAAPVLVQLVPPMNVWLRLAVIEAVTGVPEGTLREAANNRTLTAKKQKGTWLTTIENYNAWIEETSEGGGDARTAPVRAVESSDKGGRPEGKRQGSADKEGGPSQPEGERRGRKRRGKRVPIVIEIGQGMA